MNEDAFGTFDADSPQVKDLRRGVLYCLCDGVSTLSEGGWAAQTTVARLGQFFDREAPPTLPTLLQLVGEIDWELRGKGQGKAACTMASLWLHEGVAYVLQVGDSDVFHLRDDKVERLTTADFRQSSKRLDWYMGMGPRVSEALYTKVVRFEQDDVFFLMTDGVANLVTLDDMAQSWRRSFMNPRRAAEQLVALAVSRGCDDDATVVTVQIMLLEDLPDEKTDETSFDDVTDSLELADRDPLSMEQTGPTMPHHVDPRADDEESEE